MQSLFSKIDQLPYDRLQTMSIGTNAFDTMFIIRNMLSYIATIIIRDYKVRERRVEDCDQLHVLINHDTRNNTNNALSWLIQLLESRLGIIHQLIVAKSMKYQLWQLVFCNNMMCLTSGSRIW